jgi:hypothetical protein
MGVAAFGPFGNLRPVGEKTGLAGKNPDFVENDLALVEPGGNLLQRNVGPRLGERSYPLFRFSNNFPPADCRVAELSAERGPSPAGMFQPERDRKDIAAPL